MRIRPNLKHREPFSRRSLVVVTVVAFICGAAFVIIHASNAPIGFEPEGGIIVSPAAVGADVSASGGHSVEFGQYPWYSATSIGPTKHQGFAVTGSLFVADPNGEISAMQAAFPRIDALRIAIGTSSNNVVPSVSEQALIAAVATAVRMVPNIQIVLDDHQSQGAQQTGNTAADIALYQQWAVDFKNNSHVSFNTPNEPGGNSIQITAAEKQIYDTLRNNGAANRIWLEDGGNFPADYQSMINADAMVNIGMDTHLYPTTSSSNANTDLEAQHVSTLTDSAGAIIQQAAFEFGPSVTGPASGDLPNSSAYVGEVVDMAKNGPLVITTAWVWSNGGTFSGLDDLVVDSSGNIGQFGLLLQQDAFSR